MGYTVSECRDSINTNFERSGVNATISNRQLKQLLIKKFGDKICFSYSYQKSESQMFFSTEIRSGEFGKRYVALMLSLIVLKYYVMNAKSLTLDFGLDSSYCDGNDVSTSQKAFIRNRPGTRDKFFHILLEQSNLSDEKQRVCDVVFQILYKAIHYNQKRTPLPISFAQAILGLCRSKHLTIACRLGISVSYDEIERIDTSIVRRIV